MKCMELREFNAPLVPAQRDVPKPGIGEVIVKVGACGICGTDLKLWHGNHPAASKISLPLIPGHEVAGEVVEIGQDVDKALAGKHVVVALYDSCGVCEYCQMGAEPLCSQLRGQIGRTVDGGFAEYVKVYAKSLFVISGIPFEQAAIIPDAIATPYRGLVRKAKVRAGEVVLLIGVGGLGLHAVQIVKMLGATAIALDISDKALTLAKQVGADVVLNSKNVDPKDEVLKLFKGGIHAVVDFVARAESQQLGLCLLKPAGRFVSVAYHPQNILKASTPMLSSKELEIYGSRSCGRIDLQEAIDLVASGKVKPMTMEVHPLAEANKALTNLESGNLVGRSVLVP